MAGGRVHIGGDDVRLHGIALGLRARARVREGVEQIIEVERPIAIAESGRREHGPERSVGVLRSVFANARQISLDVSRIVLGVVEGRSQQENHPVVFPHEPLAHGPHRNARPFRLAGTGEHGPALRDRVDLTFYLACRTERAAVVEIGTAVPRSVPAVALHGGHVFVGAMAAAIHHRTIQAQGGMVGEFSERRNEEPGEPYALSLPMDADAAHPVVPVADADEGQTVRAACASAIERTKAVLIQ